MGKNKTLDKLMAQVKMTDPNADTSLLERAYELAESAYRDETAGGRPMIDHCLNVAGILADYQLDIKTVAAGLLHTLMEYYHGSRDELRAAIGQDLFNMVELLESLNVLKFSVDEKEQSNQLRRMFIAMARDVRIIMVKLANRLDIMRNISDMPEEERKKYARETLEIFAPLAHRLGVSQLKSEIEDLAFQAMKPEEFEKLRDNAEALREERENTLKNVIGELKEFFNSADFKVNISGRNKHLYSMYKKMMRLGINFSELFDITAVRIIVEKEGECYQALSMLHRRWTPVPGTFDDYIQEPKNNGYQSLHTVVVGPGGLPIELQIRTWEMHMTAEYGVAAHWRYKEESGGGKVADEASSWIRRVMDRGSSLDDPRTFLSDIALDPFEDSVFVMTPKGKVLSLPKNATPIDAAYLIHTDVGHRCIGARVNNKIAPLDSYLKNGDVIEILTGKVNRPSRDWLKIVRTATARSKIRSWFKKADREENVTHGRAMLEREMEHAGLKRRDILAKIGLSSSVKAANLRNEEDLFAAIGCGDVSAESVVTRVKKEYRELVEKEEEPAVRRAAPVSRRKKRDVVVEGISDILVNYSRCCYPLPGDDIIGFVSRGRGIAVHRASCRNVREFIEKNERIVPVSWDNTEGILYITEIEITSLDRGGLLNEILAAVNETKTNVAEMKSKILKDYTRFTIMRLEVADVEQAEKVAARIARIEDVLSAKRKI